MPEVMDMIGEACPFCGSINLMTGLTLSMQPMWFVLCNDCFAAGPLMVNRVRAIELWNGAGAQKPVMKFTRVSRESLVLN